MRAEQNDSWRRYETERTYGIRCHRFYHRIQDVYLLGAGSWVRFTPLRWQN